RRHGGGFWRRRRRVGTGRRVRIRGAHRIRSIPQAARGGGFPSRHAASPAELSRFIMIFLGLLAIYAIISPDVGVGFASIANLALFPVIGFGGALPTVTILLAGILTTTISSVLRGHYMNWVKMELSQKAMGAWRKEQMEAMRKG